MPLQGLLRRHRKSETDLHRRSSSIDPSHERGDTDHANDNGLLRPSGDISPYLPSASPVPSNPSPDLIPTPTSAFSGESGSARPSLDLLASHGHTQLPRPKFTFTNFRHASDSQLATTARRHAMDAAELPHRSKLPPPAIITTAPNMEPQLRSSRKRPRLRIPDRLKHTTAESSSQTSSIFDRKSKSEKALGSESMRASRVTFHEPERLNTAGHGDPPPYGDHLSSSSLALPTARLSESSRSDGSTSEPIAYATTTTTHTVSTTTTFFRLPRRKKAAAPLFPLPNKVPASESVLGPSKAGRTSTSTTRPSDAHSPIRSSAYKPSSRTTPVSSPVRGSADELTPVPRKNSTTSARSSRSSPSRPQLLLTRRGRSSTMGSLNSPDEALTPTPTPPLPSGRTSTSTAGRSSLGGLFGFSHRLRPDSESPHPRHGSPATPIESVSKANSFNLVREHLFVPEREADDTPVKYLARLEEAVSRGVVASILSRSNDSFSRAVLRSYMRSFAFFEDPMDMAIRKLLMEVELPKETQQIDRVLQSFADRYHECNPGIYTSSEQAYFIAFSLLILHTDVFNKNNKHKMLKSDYLKNTKGEGMSDDVLECFYDNISYTPFIHVEDDLDISGERIVAPRSRSSKTIFPRRSSETVRKQPKGPIDPYTLIIDHRLDSLRPGLKDVMSMDDPYSYLGSAPALDLENLQRTFFKSGVLQIISARSRPDAFKSPSTITNPNEAHPGVVDIKITKVGLLWRKDAKKKKARSPWQEWGAILTGAQLYFFRNTTWVKNLIHQYESHHKHGHAGVPVIFKPPLENFKPDALMTTDDAVALLDTSYKKHKHAFTFVRLGMFEETFLAENEKDMNDWLAKLNYAASFRTAGVRMRGLVGSQYEGQRSRGIRRRETNDSGTSTHTSLADGPASIGRYEAPVAQQVWITRRQIMSQKIDDGEDKLAALQKSLDHQLRSARHLQILAPIQAKTHEQVLLAAGRLAATIKWTRIEMWRLRCHKEVLALDLEADYKADASNGASITSAPVIPVRESSRTGVGRGDSKRTSVDSGRRVPTGTNDATEPPPSHHGLDDIFQTHPELARQSSYHRAKGSWELPPLSFTPSAGPVPSVASMAGVNVDTADRPDTATVDGRGATLADVVQIATRQPSVDNGEIEVLRDAGLVRSDGSSGRQLADAASEAEEMTELSPGKSIDTEAGDKARLRRTLHRSLRDPHTPTHHRGKKGKDSSTSTAITDDGQSTTENEGLARGAGSFTVHGKKASVITFGSEWHAMSPEDRLRMRKQSQSEGARVVVTNAADDEGDSSGAPDPHRLSFTSSNARLDRDRLLSPDAGETSSMNSRRNSRSALMAIPDHDDGDMSIHDAKSFDSRQDARSTSRGRLDKDSLPHSPALGPKPQSVSA
ncbi:MAG: hypothetical protein M1838_004227 [Thelocarpon superellum]|nr:MAG: hypothetical protein M1838_004227 [Thelocarpon superellum]